MYDVIVVGLGAMGSAAVANIASRGRKVLGIEARHPAHALSSSHGDSRIIRLAYHEDPAYVPLLRLAYRNWWRLERRLETDILTRTGVLQIGDPARDLVRDTLASCAEYGLAHEVLDKAAMADRFPGFVLDNHEVGVLDPAGGFLRPETAIWGHVRVAASDGAELHMGEKVTGVEPGAGGVTVRTTLATYKTRSVVLATGAWIAQLVPQLASRAVPARQVVAWYQPKDGFAARPERMPCFLREDDDDIFFGFPQIAADGVKFGNHMYPRDRIDPDRENAPVDEVDTAMLDSFAARRLPAVASTRVRAVTCRYTILPEERFLIDHLPGEQSVIVASACSGHGFKFASAIGEILADLSLDRGTRLPIAPFSFAAHSLV
jgi:sarcosine oxidase